MRVVNAEHPSIGYSSETVLVDLASTGDGGEQTHELVVRLAPPTAGTFRDYDLAAADDRATRGRGGRCRRSRRRSSSPTRNGSVRRSS